MILALEKVHNLPLDRDSDKKKSKSDTKRTVTVLASPDPNLNNTGEVIVQNTIKAASVQFHNEESPS